MSEAEKQQPLVLEERFWSEGAAFYRANLDDPCLCAFPELAGLLSREQVASSVPDGSRWKELVIEPQGYRSLGEGAAVLTYRARAKRADGTPYEALVSSAYVRRGDGWKLAFHQQTPLP